MYDYIVIGAGLAGATFAHFATKQGKKCLVVEKEGSIGGLCRTEVDHGITVHKYGPHIFHTNDKFLWDFVNSICEFTPYVNSPIANVDGVLFNLPINLNTLTKLYNVNSVNDAIRCLSDDIVPCKNPSNLEEQILSTGGRTIFEKLIKGYTEKQWHEKCNNLPASIIKRIPIRFVFDNNYFDDKYQGIPQCGYSAFIEQLLDGSEVLLNVNYIEHKKEIDALGKFVIYTGALDALFGYKLGKLDYRSVSFEEEVIKNCSNYQGCAVMNYTTLNTPYTRVIEHRHFDKTTNSPHTIITKEIPRNIGVDAYPVENKKNLILRANYVKLANATNIHLLGRLAQYKYLNMDTVMQNAIDLWKKLKNM